MRRRKSFEGPPSASTPQYHSMLSCVDCDNRLAPIAGWSAAAGELGHGNDQSKADHVLKACANDPRKPILSTLQQFWATIAKEESAGMSDRHRQAKSSTHSRAEWIGCASRALMG